MLDGISRTKRASARDDFVPCTDDLLSLMLLMLTKAKVRRACLPFSICFFLVWVGRKLDALHFVF